MKKLLGLLLVMLPLLGGAQVRYPVAVSGFAVQPRIFVADYLMAGSGNIRAGFTFGDLSEASREVFLHLTIESSTAKLESNPQGYYKAITLNATTDLVIDIYAINDSLVQQRPIRHALEHTERFNLGRQPGTYVVQVRAGSERKIVKILVKDE